MTGTRTVTPPRPVAVLFVVLAAFGVVAPNARAQPIDPQREIAIVVRVSLPPAFDTDGREIASVTRRLPVLTRQLAALRTEDLDAVPYALSLAGVVCDELRLMNARAARGLLRELQLQARASPVLASTYADARLSDLRPRDIEREMREGRAAVESCTSAQARNLFVPPDLTLPEIDILKEVRRAGAVLALSAFAVPFASGRPTIVPAVELDRRAEVGSLLTARPESPAIAVVVDTALHDVASVLRDIADDERFALRDVGALAKLDVIRGVIDPARRAPRRYTAAITDATDALGQFRSFILPDNRLARVFRTVLARVGSSAEFTPAYDRAIRQARALTKTLMHQQDLVSVSGGTVTFTSSRGSIPVTVANRARYPVRVLVEISSSKLRFPDGLGPVTVAPPGDTITIDAIARSTGTFPIRVAVKSQRGQLTLDSSELIVRSTAANVSAVVLTAGGALFLVAWFLRRIRQRHVGGSPS